MTGYLMRRAALKFYLSKSQRYLSNKEMMKKSFETRNNDSDRSAHTNNVNLQPEEGIPYTRMIHGTSVTESQRRKSTRQGSLFDSLTSSFRSGDTPDKGTTNGSADGKSEV